MSPFGCLEGQAGDGPGSCVLLVVVHLVVLCSLPGVSFQGPGWLCHKVAMGTGAFSVLWKEVEFYKALQTPDKDASSVSGVSGLYLSSRLMRLLVGLTGAAHLAGLQITK